MELVKSVERSEIREGWMIWRSIRLLEVTVGVGRASLDQDLMGG